MSKLYITNQHVKGKRSRALKGKYLCNKDNAASYKNNLEKYNFFKIKYKWHKLKAAVKCYS